MVEIFGSHDFSVIQNTKAKEAIMAKEIAFA